MRSTTLVGMLVLALFTLSSNTFPEATMSSSNTPEETIPEVHFEIPAHVAEALSEAGFCEYKDIIRGIPGFKACLQAAAEPGYELKVTTVTNTGPCLGGPIGDITFYFWKDFICEPPCLGPPDILIAEVYICACSVLSWTCY